MAVDPLMQGLLQGFATEAQDLCEKVTRDLLDLERPGDGAAAARLYDAVARGLHTLKGTAATVGLEDLSAIVHRLEDVLAPHRKASSALPGGVTDAMLRSLDAFLASVRAQADGRETESPLAEIHALLDSPAANGAPATAEDEPVAAPGAGRAVERTVATAAEKAAAEKAAAAEAALETDDGTWRVRVRDVMNLMREVERLRELRLRLEQRRRELEDAVAGLSAVPGLEDARLGLANLVRALGTDAEEAGDIVDSAEEGLKAIGTVPVRTILEPLRRAVRDLCRNLEKEAKVSLVGGDLALDRRVLTALRGPLIHLVRNAVDHGIEAPDTREKRGKHREGAVTVRLEQQGNMLFVTVEDDGGGVDSDRIREVAIDRGVASADKLATMAPSQVQQLIFEPGFSTARKITDTSGRGVGLDVVKNQVRGLEGHVEVQSTPGQGSRFVLTLPVEFGSSPLLAVRAGEHRFGVPMPAIEALVATEKKNLRVGRSRVQVAYRDQLVPVHLLGSMLGLGQPGVPEEGQVLLILQSQGHRLAIAVDEVLGDRDLVIRPLPLELREVAAYQGAATLAGGELLLVLRADWLVDTTAKPLVGDGAGGSRRALVVDDSLTARALHRTMLESGGFTVHTASSGPQALDQLKNATYDVVVCDIGMDVMDGYQFTQALRQRVDTRQLPVVLVSAHDSDTDRSRGLAAGADAFLSKKECVSGRLISEISAVMGRRRAAS